MAFCALLLMLAMQAAQGPVRQHVERGYALAEKGDLTAAEGELREALKLAPDDELALAVLGVVLSRQGKLEEANTYLERALKLNPREADTRYNLASNQARLGKADAAKANLDRILKEKPGHSQAAALRDAIKAKAGYDAALAQYRSGHFAESQALLDQMIADGSRDPKTFSLLAWCDHRLNQTNDALRVMRQAIEIAPADATLYANAAQILLEGGDMKAAYATAGKTLELAPDNVQALKVKGLGDLEHGDVKQALATFQRAVELDRSDPEALERLGTAQRMLFQYAEAAATFERGMARFPRYARLYAAYAKLLLDPGARPDAAAEGRAARLLEKALVLEPSLAEAHYELGKLMLDGGKAADAVGHLEAAAKLDPTNGATHLALASAYRLLARTGDQSRELRIYRDLEAQNAP